MSVIGGQANASMVNMRLSDAEKGVRSRERDAEKGVVGVEDSSGVTTPFPTSDEGEEGSIHQTHSMVRARTRNSSTEFSSIPRCLQWLFQKSNAGKEVDVSEPPDGGLRAWIIVFCCHVAGANTFGFLNAYGVLQTVYVSMLDLPPSTVSWIGSIQAFLQLFVSAFSGRFTDAGYFHQTIAFGTVLQLVGMFAASCSTTYWQLILSHGICVGLGGGLIYCPSMSLVGTYFAKKRAMALAFCAIGNSVGGLIYAAILQQTIKHAGFPWAMRVCGFLMLGTLVPANFLLKPRAIRRTPAALFDWMAFREPVYTFFALGMFTSFLGQWVPVFYLGSFGRDIIHIPTTSSGSLILIINGVGIAGRLAPALLASRFGPLNLMIPLSAFAAIILFGWAGVHNYSGILVFDVAYGFMMAAAQGMFPPSMGSLTTDLSKMGTRMGMIFAVCGFALLIGQPVAGVLITADGGQYLYAQMYAGGFFMMGAGFLGAARVYKAGWSLRVKV